MSEAQKIVNALTSMLDVGQLRELHRWMVTKREALETIKAQPYF